MKSKLPTKKNSNFSSRYCTTAREKLMPKTMSPKIEDGANWSQSSENELKRELKRWKGQSKKMKVNKFDGKQT